MASKFIFSLINCFMFVIYAYICGRVIFEQKYYSYKNLAHGSILFIVIGMSILMFFDGIVCNVLGVLAFCIYYKEVFNKNGILSGYAGMISQALRVFPKLLYLVIDSRYSDQICSYDSFACVDVVVNLVFVLVGLCLLFLLKNKIIKLRDLFLINSNRLYIFIATVLVEILFITIVRFDYIQFNNEFLLDIIICTIIFSFLCLYFDDDYKFDDLSNHYKEMCEYTNLNDSLINDYRVKLHDNKNHLLAIRSMTKDKKVIKYIDSLSDFEDIDSESYLNKLKKIPSLSVRIFINYKLCKLRELGAEIELAVSDDLKPLSEDDIPNFYTVVGIFMDNMIEYLKTQDKKLVSIQLYMEGDHIIHSEFVNSFSGSLNIKDLYTVGFSTKGIGRGIGLPIVKKTIDSNPRYQLETKIIDDFFIQHVIVDLNK